MSRPLACLLAVVAAVGVLAQEPAARLQLGPDGELFTATKGTSAFMPGSGQCALVDVERVFGGCVWLAVRTKAGRVLLPQCSIYQHSEAVFWLADEEYTLRVEDVHYRVIGHDTVDLRVLHRWSPPERGEGERAAAPPLWFEVVAGIDAGLAGVQRAVERAGTLLDRGDADGARAVAAAAQSSAEALRGLAALRPPPRPDLGPGGSEFTVPALHCVPVPGSRGWLEVVVAGVQGPRAWLGVRTASGDSLAIPRAVAVGDEVVFRSGGQAYALGVRRVDAKWSGGGAVVLRVAGRDLAGVPAQAGGSVLGSKVLELMEAHAARALAETQRAEALLATGGDAGDAIAAAQRSASEARLGMRWLQQLGGQRLLDDHVSVVEDLALVRVRVASTRPELDRDPDFLADTSLGERMMLGLATRAAGLPAVFAEEVQAQVAGVPWAGSRHALATRAGRKSPMAARDLVPGQTLELHLWQERQDFPDLRGLEAGQEYWLAITPPVALKALPRAAGTSGRSWIAFAMRTTGP